MNDTRWVSASDPYVTPEGGDAWAKEAAAAGGKGTQRLLAVETVAVRRHIREALRLGPDERAVVRQRLILLNDQPIELADSYYPESITAGTVLAEHRKIKGGAVAALAELGHIAAEVTENVSARQPLPHECDVLGIRDSDCLLVLTRIIRDADGRPVQYDSNRTVARLTRGHTYQKRVVR